MKKFIQKISLAGLCLMLSSGFAHAQGLFVNGDFVEVGLATTGAFGTCPVPASYHANVNQFCGGSFVPVLGFVADPDKDGWLVSSPGRAAYMGDYFVPGSPYEGWDLEAGGFVYRYRNDASGGACPGLGTCTLLGTTVTATEQTATWQGTQNGLLITQKTVIKKDKLYFVNFIEIQNISGSTINNIYYFRGLDPDNDQPWLGGSYSTDNRIVFQPNAISRNCLVTATGRGYPDQAYLGLGTKDCRAKCCIFNAWPFTGTPSNVYSQSGTASTAAGYKYNMGDSTINQDIAIGLVFNLGSLATGQKTNFAFTYILKQADLDSALGETAPKFGASGTPYAPYTTFRECPGNTIDLNIINGGQYKWVWTTDSIPGYIDPIGTSVAVAPGGTIPAVTDTITYPKGAVYGDSVRITIRAPRTYRATGYSNCDTQVLIFYADTLSFSTPPAVISPVRYCQGETASPLTAASAAGAVLNWYATDTGKVALGAAPTPSTLFTGKSGTDFDTTDYFVSQTNASGCETPRARIQVIVTKKPASPEVRDTFYCIGAQTYPLRAEGKNLKWYDAATAGTKYTMTPVPLNAPAGVQSFWVSQSINNCESQRVQVNVEISQAIAAFDLSSDSLCGDEQLIMINKSTSSSAGGLSSAWKFGDGGGSVADNPAHSYQDKRADNKVSLRVQNALGCTDSMQKDVHIFPRPSIVVGANLRKICQGEAIDFYANATAGYRALAWNFGDQDPAYNVTKVRHAFSQAGLFTVRLNGNYPACPDVGDELDVEVTPIPKVNLGADLGFCTQGKPLNLHNLAAIAGARYQWSTGDTSADISVTQAGIYWLRARIDQCAASDTVEVYKDCYLDIPNAFTPGSASGAYFLPRQLSGKSVITFHMQIFDRWGQLIFETDKIDGRGWDGNFKGQPMPFGVYVYLIQVSFANGTSEDYSGNLTLIR